MSNKIDSLIQALETDAYTDRNGQMLLQAAEVIRTLNERLTEAEETIAWLKACKEGGVYKSTHTPSPYDASAKRGRNTSKRNPNAT